MAEIPPSLSFRLGTILLAAGASTRMGAPKLLLSWGSTSVLGHHLQVWRRLGAQQIAVVCAAADARLFAEMDRFQVSPGDRILNSAPERGMFSSIRAAALWQGWTPELTHWAVVLGDQPQVSEETLRHVLDFAAANPRFICQPSRGGRPRHPVVMPAEYFRQIASCHAANLKVFLEGHTAARAWHEMNDPALDLDLDTPAEYANAVKKYRQDYELGAGPDH